MIKHLLSTTQLSRDDVTRILDTAESFREVGTRVIKKVPALRGKVVVNLFFEDSTRTKTSFSLAAQRMSANGAAKSRCIPPDARHRHGRGPSPGSPGVEASCRDREQSAAATSIPSPSRIAYRLPA